MTRIKFCGMTREADIRAAVALGVDAVGFVFWPGSPRHIDVGRARTLIDELPDEVTAVGVFVSPTSDAIVRAVDHARIRVAQVHGELRSSLDDVGCELWFAASLATGDLSPAVGRDYTVLLDAPDPVRFGGTGRTIDWDRAARVAEHRRVWLAGGLTPANVGAAIRRVRPYGVDVASGIEKAPGLKDAAVMRAFVAAVREANQ